MVGAAVDHEGLVVELGRDGARLAVGESEEDHVVAGQPLGRRLDEGPVGVRGEVRVHLTQTLAKWSAKIAAVAPATLLAPSRTAFSARGAQGVKSVAAQVDEALAADGEKLLARTRVRRGAAAAAAAGQSGGEPEEDVFDDTDFYQQLLRSVIDAREGAGTGAADWMALQKQKKARKAVDTKASKGRKLRWVCPSPFLPLPLFFSRAVWSLASEFFPARC